MWEHGKLTKEVTSIEDCWREDFVSFLIGCSFSFEEALQAANIPIRHIEQGSNVPMYNTNVENQPAGIFGGSLVVSMRPMTPQNAIKATEITARYSKVHGAPIHIGDPATIGIIDISKPDYGSPVLIKAGEACVFWACGVTP